MLTEAKFLDLFSQWQTQLLQQIDERFRGLDGYFEGIGKRVAAMEMHLQKELDAKWEALQQELREGLQTIRERFDQQDRRLDHLEADSEFIKQRLDHLEVGEEKLLTFMKERFDQNQALLEERFDQVYDFIRQSEEDQETNFNQVLRAMNLKNRR
ncbi:hypothetical protein EV586_11043 [Tumebacillus sp. BK434]|uniref:hypothetical protein n=1 Tax=Tumebacillus sp. BK434 TaxID=2512169 RepID=UPI001045BF4E|nr:hypothetical protein [Tumebacillus sp. BK434]TCP52444.1 hypothetical protein EV586_11043 [Tumebacillus sp. BK434]